MATLIIIFLIANGLSAFFVAGFSKREMNRNLMWIAAALFFIAAGIWRLK
jgi:hypothetical protein